MSVESGLKTFRDANGLWEQYRIEEVATLDAWHRDPKKVLHFYNLRRMQLMHDAPGCVDDAQGYRPKGSKPDWFVSLVATNHGALRAWVSSD